MYLEECGVFVTEEGEMQTIYGTSGKDGVYELYYNDDPYAVMCLTGFKGLDIVSLDEFGVEESEIREAISMGARGTGVKGIITLNDKLLVIKDTFPFVGEIQPRRYDGTAQLYEQYVDISEVECDATEYEDLCEVMCII